MVRLIAVAALCSVAGCSTDYIGPPERFPLLFHISGTVTSATTDAPVAGARVVFGVGGYYGPPSDLAVTLTDAEGRYSIETEFAVAKASCPFLWMIASAGDFRTSDMEDSNHAVRCVEQQSITIRLQPR